MNFARGWSYLKEGLSPLGLLGLVSCVNNCCVSYCSLVPPPVSQVTGNNGWDWPRQWERGEEASHWSSWGGRQAGQLEDGRWQAKISKQICRCFCSCNADVLVGFRGSVHLNKFSGRQYQHQTLVTQSLIDLSSTNCCTGLHNHHVLCYPVRMVCCAGSTLAPMCSLHWPQCALHPHNDNTEQRAAEQRRIVCPACSLGILMPASIQPGHYQLTLTNQKTQTTIVGGSAKLIEASGPMFS